MFDAPFDADGSPGQAGLGGLAPGWQVVVARDRRPIGFRLHLHRNVGAPSTLRLNAVLDAVLAGLVAQGSKTFPHGMVLLAPGGGFDLATVLAEWNAPRNVFLEVAQAELNDAERVRQLFDAQRQGLRMALRLDGTTAPDQHRLQLFQYVIGGPGVVLPRLPAGTVLSAEPACAADADAAFARGAHAVLGWPLLAPVGARALEPLQRSVLDMIRLAQSDADVAVLERGFRGDPILAFMLLTLANSPAFVRVKKIASLTQAILVLGYARLVKWLVLMLVIASKDGRSVPIIYTAVVRGFLIEQAAAACGQSREAQDDGFVVGAFSLLQVICGQTAEQLFAQVELPAPIRAALTDGSGPHGPALALARAFETQDEEAMRAACAAMGLTCAAANAALLHALSATDALQGVV